MLDPSVPDRLDALLAADDEQRLRRFPGQPAHRQPVHTVYVPADQIRADTVRTWGAAAQQALADHGPIPGFGDRIHELVRTKLAREPIEDLRVDFEDGYGVRGDDEEDATVRASASALAAAAIDGSAPMAVGVRMKSLEHSTRRRGIRTLDLFLESLLARVALPPGFRVTVPKVTSVAQVSAMVELCKALEAAHGLQGLRFELQVEAPQPVLGADGTSLIAPMLHASRGRCIGLHFGTYDYTAALGIAAAQQSLEHPAADHAKAVLQVAAAETGVDVSDGSTNVLPVGEREQVHAAWQLHARLVRRSLERGFYQGWDLHPAQLPTRFATTFAFYRDGLDVAAERLRRYLSRSAGGVLDEPATARALSGFLLRALRAGAVDRTEIHARTGLDEARLSQLSGRSALRSET